MPDKKRFLKSVNVSFISLVDKGANRKKIIYKTVNPQPLSKGKGLQEILPITEEVSFDKTVQITKLDEDQRIVYGIVYSPDEVDTDGDYTSAEVIKQMAYDFMKNRNTNNVDHQHDYTPDEGYIAESWLLEKNDPRFPDEPEGSWAVGIKVTNDDTWQKVKTGKITGLSMAGVASVEEVHDHSSRDSLINRVVKIIKEGISAIKQDFQSQSNNNKNKESNMTNEEVTAIVKSAADSHLSELQKSLDDFKNLVESKYNEFENRLKVVEEASPGSSQFITKEENFKHDKSYKGPGWLS